MDYLGDLGAKLRDLRGYATLAHELIQNADDAPGALSMSFDVRTDALIVDNDGLFSDCGKAEDEDECPWKVDPNIGYRCDFHRFRHIAAGDKRAQSDTAGAFGIGFISVYQITDHPELISNGKHWIIHEDQPEDRRIEVCPGCGKCSDASLRGTRFLLPWARDPESVLRQALKTEAVQEEDIRELLIQLKRVIPTAMLFLRKLNCMIIKDNNATVASFDRILEDNTLIVSDGKSDHIWHLLHGDFEVEAAEQKKKNTGRIEDKRSSTVTIAIPDGLIDKGVFCAYLPTEHETGLPFHINADFFPTNDRKRILLGDGYQSAWNKSAIIAAARAFQSNLELLPRLLGHEKLWDIINSLYQVGQESEKGQKEPTLKSFWQSVAPQLSVLSVVYTTKREWKKPIEVRLLEKEEEHIAIPLLEDLDIRLIHPDLRPYFGLFRRKEVGVALLDIVDIYEALRVNGFDKQRALSKCPNFLCDRERLQILWDELKLLLKRDRKIDDQKNCEKSLSACAIAPGPSDVLWPCGEIFRADLATIKLFATIDSSIPFVSDFGREDSLMRLLCPEFTASAAIQRLGAIFADENEEVGKRKLSFNPAELLNWFELRRKEIAESNRLKGLLRALPIYPSSEGLSPLSELSLPGNFIDPLGIAGIVDVARLQGRRDFLRVTLEAEELSFKSYCSKHITTAFEQLALTNDQKRRVVKLLAERLGEIKDDYEILESLRPLLLVECQDGLFHNALSVYLNDDAKKVLGEDIAIAVIPPDSQESTSELYRWLGVRIKPRLDDVVRRVRAIIEQPPSVNSVNAVQKIVAHLGIRFKETADLHTEPLNPLKTLTWLPARKGVNRWHKPSEVYAEFQSYLFETQADFIALAIQIQQSSTEFFTFVGVNDKPTTDQIVDHLLVCAEANTQVNTNIYKVLNEKAADQAITKLRNKNCLLLPSNKYVAPEKVFWNDHAFGRFRYKLGSELRSYNDLFSRLGVRDNPTEADAMQVLLEVAEEYGKDNRALDDEAHAVVISCWKILSSEFEAGNVGIDALIELGQNKAIPGPTRMLYPASWIFFEDRAGLGAKFDSFLKNNVISRPPGAWQGMAAAGVTPLTTVITSRLVECSDPLEDDSLAERLKRRSLELKRVFDVPGSAIEVDYDICGNIVFKSASDLKVQFVLKAFNRERTSEVESALAHFDRDSLTLYYARRNGLQPWATIARELALAMCPDEEPGRFAVGIKEVLMAESKDAAKALLDELGFSALQETPDLTAPIEEVSDLGGSKESVESTEIGEKGQNGTDIEGEKRDAVDQAIEDILGKDGAAPTGIPEGVPPEDTKPGPGPGRGKGSSKGKPSSVSKGGKLRTYVIADRPDDKPKDGQTERDPIDQIGVEKVMDFERRQGRFPKEMPPFHEGYDVESRNAHGIIERYIEVKARSGNWDIQGVGLSRPQFKKGEALGDSYWLYVVERARQHDHEIHRIQNPSLKANQFFFDDGWVQTEEDGD